MSFDFIYHASVRNLTFSFLLFYVNCLRSGISQFTSDTPPAHYVVKVESFSLLTENSIERYESREFDAGGYEWRLILYPDGNKKNNVKDHISLYLALEGASSLSPGWEIYVTFRFFLLDQNKDNYLIVEGVEFGTLRSDTLRKQRRFHQTKVEWGFDEFISHKEFKNRSNGYLVDDTCVFGAEVYVCKERNTCQGECLTMMKYALAQKHTWQVNNFSKLKEESYDSQPFDAGNYKWKMKLYPKGKGVALGKYISLYLALADPASLSPASKIYATVILRILDKKESKHYFRRANFWFTSSMHKHGWTRFSLLSLLTSKYLESYSALDINYGIYVPFDRCYLEAEITILGVVDELP